jgi:ribosomal protein S17E
VEGVLGVVRVTALYYKRHQLLERNREAGYETELMQQMQQMQQVQQAHEPY